MEEKMELEVDLVDLFHYLKNKIIWILLVALAGGIFGYYNAKSKEVISYTATCDVYVLERNDQGNLDTMSMSLSTQVGYDVRALLVSDVVLQVVIDDLGVPYTTTGLKSKIFIPNDNNPRLVEIRVYDADPQHAIAIADSLATVGAAVVKDLMELEKIQQVSFAKAPFPQSNVMPERTAILWGGGLAVVLIMILAVMRILDNTIRSEEDVERYLGLSTLGVIPEVKALETKKTVAYKSKRLWKKLKRRIKNIGK